MRRDAENVRKEWNEDEQSLGGQKIDSNQNSLPVVQPEIVGDRQDQRRSQYDALSREEINRQVAELRNHQEQAAQPQLKVASMLPVQRQDELQKGACFLNVLYLNELIPNFVIIRTRKRIRYEYEL